MSLSVVDLSQRTQQTEHSPRTDSLSPKKNSRSLPFSIYKIHWQKENWKKRKEFFLLIFWTVKSIDQLSFGAALGSAYFVTWGGGGFGRGGEKRQTYVEGRVNKVCPPPIVKKWAHPNSHEAPWWR